MPLLWGNAGRIFNLPVMLDSFLVVAALRYSKGILFFGARATARVAPTLMNSNNQNRESLVILSAAKNLPRHAEILRCAQNDSADFGRSCSSGIHPYPMVFFCLLSGTSYYKMMGNGEPGYVRRICYVLLKLRHSRAGRRPFLQ